MIQNAYAILELRAFRESNETSLFEMEELHTPDTFYGNLIRQIRNTHFFISQSRFLTINLSVTVINNSNNLSATHSHKVSNEVFSKSSKTIAKELYDPSSPYCSRRIQKLQRTI